MNFLLGRKSIGKEKGTVKEKGRGKEWGQTGFLKKMGP
jgi:hypothetical protein